MLSNDALADAMVQVSAEYALREAQLRASWTVVVRLYAIDMQCWRPLARSVGVPVLGAAGMCFGAFGVGAFGAAGVDGPGVFGRIRAAGRLPGLHSGPSPPAVGLSALHHR